MVARRLVDDLVIRRFVGLVRRGPPPWHALGRPSDPRICAELLACMVPTDPCRAESSARGRCPVDICCASRFRPARGPLVARPGVSPSTGQARACLGIVVVGTVPRVDPRGPSTVGVHGPGDRMDGTSAGRPPPAPRVATLCPRDSTRRVATLCPRDSTRGGPPAPAPEILSTLRLVALETKPPGITQSGSSYRHGSQCWATPRLGGLEGLACLAQFAPDPRSRPRWSARPGLATVAAPANRPRAAR